MNAAYWSRSLKSWVGMHVTVTTRGERPGSVDKVHGVVTALGVNHVRLSERDVRYDKILSVEL